MTKEKIHYIWNKVEILKDFRIINYTGGYNDKYPEYTVCNSFLSDDKTKFNQWYNELSVNGKNVFEILCKLVEDCDSTEKAIYVIDIHCSKLIRGNETIKEFVKRHSHLLSFYIPQ